MPELDGHGKKVTWRGPKGTYKKAKTKYVRSEESFLKQLREKKVHPGCRWSKTANCLICELCDVHVEGSKTMFDEHFGFGKNKVNAKHLKQLQKALVEKEDVNGAEDKPRQKTVEEMGAERVAAKELKRELFGDLVLFASEANITAGQMDVFRPFLVKWLKPGAGFVKEADFEWQFRSKRPALYQSKMDELEANAKKHQQLTIAVDAGTDARHAKGMYFTLDFGMESFLWKTLFEGQMNSQKLVRMLNENVIKSFDSFDAVDIVTGDRIAYHLAAFRSLHELAAPNTLFLPDVCHGADGLLSALAGPFSLINEVVYGLKRTFRSNYGFANAEWEDFQLAQGLYPRKVPSAGNTRAWAGTLKVVHFALQRFDALVTFFEKKDVINQLSSRMDSKVLEEREHLDGAKKLARILTEDADTVFFLMVCFAQFSQVFHHQILLGQSRVQPSMHKVHTFYSSVRSCFAKWTEQQLNNTKGKFEELLESLDPLLLPSYKALPSASKPSSKRQVFEGVLAVKALLFKNWGNIEVIKADKAQEQNELCLKVRQVGDCWTQEAHAFYLIAAFADPHQARSFGMPPSLSVVEQGICWKLPHGCTNEQLYNQLSDYVHHIDKALLPDSGTIDLVSMWRDLAAGSDKFSLHVGDLLAHTMLRIITKPSGAAQVERAVSVVTDVLSKKRLSMANQTLSQAAFLRAQSTRRKVLAVKREVKTRKRKELIRFKLAQETGLYSDRIPLNSELSARQAHKLKKLQDGMKAQEPRPTKRRRNKRKKK